MRGKVRVLLADDQRLFAESISTLIREYADDIEIVGIASNGKEAVRLAEALEPHLVLMDVRMPGLSGVEAAKEILSRLPKTRIMMLSTYDEDEYVKEALRLGASGYLLKDISPTELIASIRAIRGGAVQISPSVAARLVERLSDKRGELPALQGYSSLTQREKQIFVMLSKGYVNKQIAKELFIAEQTVRNHVSLIYSKLGIKSRFELIRLANELGAEADSQEK